jgi:hypothetical protein
MKYLLFGLITALGVAIVLIHIIIFITDDDRYMGTTSAVLLGLSACISLFIVLSKPKTMEVRKFKLLFVGVTLWFLGEFTYTYYQFALNADAPYPGPGEIFYVAGYVPLILFTYRSFKTMNRAASTKRRWIAFVVIIVSVVPVISTIQIFTQQVDLQSQWPDIALNVIYNYGDVVLLSLSILILAKLPRTNPYIYHWILFTSFLILATITDLIYTYIAIVDEEFLSTTEVLWEAMWAFAYLCVFASLFWYYKLVHLLSGNSEDLSLAYPAKHRNNILDQDKSELYEDDQFYTENTQNFKLVEDRIAKTIKDTKEDITIFFPNEDALKRKETEIIRKFLNKKGRSNILARILLPLNANEIIIDNFREVASVRIFERKLESNKIIIVIDYVKSLLLASTYSNIDDKEPIYAITYSENKELTYTYATIFEKLWLLQAVTELEIS